MTMAAQILVLSEAKRKKNSNVYDWILDWQSTFLYPIHQHELLVRTLLMLEDKSLVQVRRFQISGLASVKLVFV